MNDLTNKQSGLLFGSYCADALSLGVHWIYDANELAQKHGRVTHYKAPGADSYHPHKQAGDQGHVGDQSLCLLKFLSREKKWDPSMFMDDWLGMWPDYNDYVDGATKATLANVQNQTDKTQGGSDSVEIAGPARIAPLIVIFQTPPKVKWFKQRLNKPCLPIVPKKPKNPQPFSPRQAIDSYMEPTCLIPSTKRHPSGHSKKQTVCSRKMPWMQSVNSDPPAPFHPPSPPFSI